jgi:hypothetical protein
MLRGAFVYVKFIIFFCNWLLTLSNAKDNLRSVSKDYDGNGKNAFTSHFNGFFATTDAIIKIIGEGEYSKLINYLT